jgi:hypothetical protein
MPDPKTNVNDPDNFEVVWDTPEETKRLGVPDNPNDATKEGDGEQSD